MVLQMIIALLAVVIAGSVHFQALRQVSGFVHAKGLGAYQGFLVLIVAITISQSIVALIFAGAFEMSSAFELGYLKVDRDIGFMEVFAFSMINLTTLGLGDVIPMNHLKFLAAIEAMTGFLVISCSASHVFQVMKLEDK